MPDHKLYEYIYPDKSGCPVDCYATNIPYNINITDDVTGIFYWHNPSGSGVDSASNRNEYQEYFLGGKKVAGA